MYNFNLVNADTDSISVCKKDGSPFSEEEKISLLKELNSQFDEEIKWENDGEFKVFIVLTAKNYIMYDGNKIKMKGSSLKDQKKEPILLKMIKDIIDDLVFNDAKNVKNIKDLYMKKVDNIENIKDWCQKRTVTKSILNCGDPKIKSRKQEIDVYDAIKNTHVQEGDKIYVYPYVKSQTHETITYKNGKSRTKTTIVTGLKISEDYNNDEYKDRLIKRIDATLDIFKNVIDI